jgi:hypothetical protein
MRQVYIEPQHEGKGRTFQALCLAAIEADLLWTGGSTPTDNMRPVWAMFAGSDQEMRPFAANLVTGRKVSFGHSSGYRSRKEDRLEILRSAGYQLTWQRELEGSIATIFLPDLFQLDPGMVDVTGANFIALPTLEWIANQKIEMGRILKHATKLKYPLGEDVLAAMIPLSFLFCAYLDRRTRCPIYSDDRFYLQLMLACLNEGLASWPTTGGQYHYREPEFGRNPSFKFTAHWITDVGLATPIAFHANHEEVERVLAEQVALFFKITGGR